LITSTSIVWFLLSSVLIFTEPTAAGVTVEVEKTIFLAQDENAITIKDINTMPTNFRFESTLFKIYYFIWK
jgi:hypothetical protein